MPLATLMGLDHVMIVVRDLARAADTWRRLGFTISPMGVHSAHLGSANYTIMFGDDYLELLGILAETPHNAGMRALLAKREGIDRVAFTTLDAAAGAAALKSRGLQPEGPFDFGRPVDLPDGGKTQASFRTFKWPAEQRPGGLGLFACQHLTREAVWIPQLQRHANTATRIARVEIISQKPRAAAEQLAGLIDEPALSGEGGVVRVPSGRGRAEFHILDRTQFTARHAGVALGELPEEGAMAVVIAVADMEAARRATGGLGFAGENRIDVAPSAANGVLVSFIPETA